MDDNTDNHRLVNERALSLNDYSADTMYLDRYMKDIDKIVEELDKFPKISEENYKVIKTFVEKSSLTSNEIKDILVKIEALKSNDEIKDLADKITDIIPDNKIQNTGDLKELAKTNSDLEKLIKLQEKILNSEDKEKLNEKIIKLLNSDDRERNAILSEINTLVDNIETNNKETIVNELKNEKENTKVIKDIYDDLKDSKYLAVKEKEFLKEMMSNNNLSTLDLKSFLQSFNENEKDSKALIKYLSNYANAVEKDEKLSTEEKEQFKKEFSNIIKEYKDIGKVNDAVLTSIEKLESNLPKDLKIEDNKKLLEEIKNTFTNKSNLDSVFKSITDELKEFKGIDIEMSNSFKEFEKGELSYNEFIDKLEKELKETMGSEDAIKILRDMNSQISDLVDTEKLNNKVFTETIKDTYKKTIDELSSSEKKTLETLSKQYENSEISFEDYTKSLKSLLNLTEEQVKDLSDIKKYQNQSDLTSMAKELNEKKKSELETELLEKLNENANQSQVKENESLFKQIVKTGSLESAEMKLGTKLTEKMFKLKDGETLGEKLAEKFSEKTKGIRNKVSDKFSNFKESIKDKFTGNRNRRNVFERDTGNRFENYSFSEQPSTERNPLRPNTNHLARSENISNTLNSSNTSNISNEERFRNYSFSEHNQNRTNPLHPQSARLIGNAIRNKNRELQRTLNQTAREDRNFRRNFVRSNQRIDQSLVRDQRNFERQIEREVDSNSGSSSLFDRFGGNNRRNRRPRGRMGRFLSKGKNLLSRVGGKTGSLLSKVGSLGALAEGAMDIGGIAETAGAAIGGIGEAAGAVTALASNPIGWAVGGALALGAAGVGLYHLSIDDDSEEVMDKLEKTGAVEHSFFGDSEIKDWKQIYALNPKQVDALIRFDDWSKDTKNKLKEIKKLGKSQKELNSFIQSGYIKVTKDGKLEFNEDKLKSATGKSILQKITKLSIPSDLETKEFKEVIKKAKSKSTKKENKDKADNKDSKIVKNNKDLKSKDNKLSKENKENKDNLLDNLKKIGEDAIKSSPIGMLATGISHLFGNDNDSKNNKENKSGLLGKIGEGLKSVTPLGGLISGITHLFGSSKPKHIIPKISKTTQQGGLAKSLVKNENDPLIDHYLKQGMDNPALIATLTNKPLNFVSNYMNKKNVKSEISLSKNIPETELQDNKPIIINQSKTEGSKGGSLPPSPPPSRITDDSLKLMSAII